MNLRPVLLALFAALLGGFLAFSHQADAGDYGKCSFNSDCHPNVKCNSGRCADAAGGKCSFNSDCGAEGAKCNSGKCSTAPDGTCAFNSECPGGKCSSGKCVK